MIERSHHLQALHRLLAEYPVVALLGARQTGKTTLALELAQQHARGWTRFDLEDPADNTRLSDPRLALQELRGLVILDEIQRQPDLFPVLRVLADRPRKPARFLVLGSASPALLRQSSESLAGRIAYYRLPGLRLDEVGSEALDRLWLRGGFPRSFLARSHRASYEWRRNFVRTYLERDLPQLGITIASSTLRRFWTMIAHYHGQLWNGSELARAFGVADTTVRRYLDILTDAFVVRQLQPWIANLRKRQVKSPRVYVDDTGLLHTLLGIENRLDLEHHPKIGASWEGLLISQVIQLVDARSEQCFFWRTHTGAELDLLLRLGRRNLGFEFKRTVSPSVTRSMHSALEDLELDQLTVVHAGEDSFPLAKRVRAVAACRLVDELG